MIFLDQVKCIRSDLYKINYTLLGNKFRCSLADKPEGHKEELEHQFLCWCSEGTAEREGCKQLLQLLLYN